MLKTIMRLSVFTILTASATQASAERITFFEGNRCRGPIAFEYNGITSRVESCKWSNARCRNDTARSVLVRDIRGAVTISVFDHPDGRKTDDWGTINLRDATRGTICVPSFERAVETGGYNQNYARRNGLDGKVSRVSIKY